MHFLAIADTDIGIARATNQDSALVKHAVYGGSEVLLAVLCDGMGGLSRGGGGQCDRCTGLRQMVRGGASF